MENYESLVIPAFLLVIKIPSSVPLLTRPGTKSVTKLGVALVPRIKLHHDVSRPRPLWCFDRHSIVSRTDLEDTLFQHFDKVLQCHRPNQDGLWTGLTSLSFILVRDRDLKGKRLLVELFWLV